MDFDIEQRQFNEQTSDLVEILRPMIIKTRTNFNHNGEICIHTHHKTITNHGIDNSQYGTCIKDTDKKQQMYYGHRW